MSEFAIMPLIDYVKSCDKIREITNTDEKIMSGEFSKRIEGVFETGKRRRMRRFGGCI